MPDDEPAVPLVDAALELFVPLDDELDEVDGLEADAGTKLSFVVPKPMAEAKVPLIVTMSLLVSPVRTKLPLALSDAVTCAFPAPALLMAPIRSATVSLPVVEYVVIFEPSPMVNPLFGGIPRVDNGVLVVSGTVPVPVARDDPEGPDEVEELEAEESAADDELLLLTAFWSRSVIWLLTRFKAV